MLLSTNGVSFVIVLLCACRYPFYSGAHYLVGDVQIYLKQARFFFCLIIFHLASQCMQELIQPRIHS